MIIREIARTHASYIKIPTLTGYRVYDQDRFWTLNWTIR